MSLLPDPLVQAQKAVAKGVGVLNSAQRTLLELLDTQNKNLFEVILYPTHLATKPFEIAGQVAATAFDLIIARLHLQNLGLSFNGLEFERHDKVQYIKNLERANECTMTFVENELALMRNYFASWTNSIYYWDTTKETYIFSDNQKMTKKNAKILLQSTIGLPNPVWISVEGLIPKSIGTVELGQLNTEAFMIEATFAIDNINISSIYEKAKSAAGF